jgi:hypothetical protein
MRDRRFVMTRFIRITVGMFVFGWISPSAWAGPDWEEICDAGSSVGFAQPVSGGGSSVRSIRGRLGACPVAGSEGPDLEDVFLIFIDDPSQFCAKTVPKGESALCCSVCPPDCDSAIQGSNFNTQLWLFKADGTGLLGNDDELGGPPGLSRMGNAATDASGAAVTTPGLYYLAISGGRQRDPISIGGPIFNQASPFEVSGPDGPGGAQPLNAWNGPGVQGDYEIFLCGVRFIEGIPTVSEWGMAVLTLMVATAGAVLAKRAAA